MTFYNKEKQEIYTRSIVSMPVTFLCNSNINDIPEVRIIYKLRLIALFRFVLPMPFVEYD